MTITLKRPPYRRVMYVWAWEGGKTWRTLPPSVQPVNTVLTKPYKLNTIHAFKKIYLSIYLWIAGQSLARASPCHSSDKLSLPVKSDSTLATLQAGFSLAKLAELFRSFGQGKRNYRGRLRFSFHYCYEARLWVDMSLILQHKKQLLSY